MKASVPLLLLAGLVAAPAAASGQGLSGRVLGIDDGTARITFDTKPGVEICDQGIRMGEHRHFMWRTWGWEDDEPRNCRTGSAEVEVEVRDGDVRDVEILLRARDRTPDAVDLGGVPPREAADFFLAVARGEVGRRSEEDAILPAVLADVEGLWPELLDMAKDRSLDEDVRTSSLFWVSQEAAEAVTGGIAGVALDEEEDQDIRDAAVFALSQRPDVEGVPILMDVARTARSGETRRSAMFWLAQSKDERVYAFFEEILGGRGGGGG